MEYILKNYFTLIKSYLRIIPFTAITTTKNKIS